MNATGGGEEAQVLSYLQGGPGITESPADALIRQTEQAYVKQAKEYEGRLTEFEKRSPFVFDKILEAEQQKVSQRLDPYYNQTLSDFLRGIERTRTRSVEDERTLLTDSKKDI